MTYKFERCKECRNPDHLLTVIERAKRHLKILYKEYPETRPYVHHLAHHLFDCLMLFGFDKTKTCEELVQLFDITL